MEATEKSQRKEASATVNQTPGRNYQILAEDFHGQVAAYLRISPQV